MSGMTPRERDAILALICFVERMPKPAHMNADLGDIRKQLCDEAESPTQPEPAPGPDLDSPNFVNHAPDDPAQPVQPTDEQRAREITRAYPHLIPHIAALAATIRQEERRACADRLDEKATVIEMSIGNSASIHHRSDALREAARELRKAEGV